MAILRHIPLRLAGREPRLSCQTGTARWQVRGSASRIARCSEPGNKYRDSKAPPNARRQDADWTNREPFPSGYCAKRSDASLYFSSFGDAEGSRFSHILGYFKPYDAKTASSLNSIGLRENTVPPKGRMTFRCENADGQMAV